MVVGPRYSDHVLFAQIGPIQVAYFVDDLLVTLLRRFNVGQLCRCLTAHRRTLSHMSRATPTLSLICSSRISRCSSLAAFDQPPATANNTPNPAYRHHDCQHGSNDLPRPPAVPTMDSKASCSSIRPAAGNHLTNRRQPNAHASETIRMMITILATACTQDLFGGLGLAGGRQDLGRLRLKAGFADSRQAAMLPLAPWLRSCGGRLGRLTPLPAGLVHSFTQPLLVQRANRLSPLVGGIHRLACEGARCRPSEPFL